MKLQRHTHNPILNPDNKHPWEAKAVMNASVIRNEKTFHMLYRALGTEHKTFPSGKMYHRSVIGYATSIDGIRFSRRDEPFLAPEHPWENLGCEDPRITNIDETYYIFYTAVSVGTVEEKAVKIAGAATRDFQTIEKFGAIALSGRCKAAALFPEKINDKYVFLYTQNADRPESTIYITFIKDITMLFDKKKWDRVEKIPLLTPSPNAVRGPELGAVPIKTDKGWLLIFCPESFKKEWAISAVLLDLSDPTRIIGQTKQPILRPEKVYETKGYVNNVTFPSGAVIVGEKLYVYYGGGDSGVCLATCDVNKLVASVI
jgi:beta-1,2-mannobiose phosphorylase / 1,2-beta-oligomannan phosphorylase